MLPLNAFNDLGPIMTSNFFPSKTKVFQKVEILVGEKTETDGKVTLGNSQFAMKEAQKKGKLN